jgi:hypothetical protein
MNRMNIIYSIIILLCLIFKQNLFAQKSDCLIYDKILLHFDKEHSNIKYVYKGVNDPENPVFNKVRIKGKRALSFFIVKDKSEFGLTTVEGWFAELLNDTTIIKKDYTTYKNTITVNCQFCRSVKYQFVDFTNVTSFSEKDYSTTGKGRSLIYYAPARVVFSNILYHADQTALVYAKLKVGSGGGSSSIYGFAFKKKKNNWVLKKVEKETR